MRPIFLWALILLASCSQPSSDKSDDKQSSDDDDEGSGKKRGKKKKASATSAEPAPPPPRAATVEEACAELAAARCAQYESCHHGYEIRWRYGDLPACKAAVTAHCLDLARAPDAAIGAPEVSACAQSTGSECTAGPLTLTKCSFKGKRAAGAACAVGSQCQSGFCNKGHGEACGKCLPIVAAGDSCKTFADCLPLACHDKKCAERVAVGGDCSKTPYCDGGSLCHNGKCTFPPKEGEACVRDSEIVAEDCTYQYECSQATKTCAPRKLAAAGDACGVGIFCGNSSCNFTTKKCLPLLKEGEGCQDTYECVQPLECLDKRCVMPGKAQCN